MDIVRKNYPELPPTGAPHFQSVRAGNLLFLAGATARGTEAEFGDIAEQTDVILILNGSSTSWKRKEARWTTWSRSPAS